VQAQVEQARQLEIQRMIDELRNLDIEGFLPTSSSTTAPAIVLLQATPQSPLDGHRLQCRRLQFFFQLAHVFRVRVLHERLLAQTAKLLNLLQRVAQQHSVARSRSGDAIGTTNRRIRR